METKIRCRAAPTHMRMAVSSGYLDFTHTSTSDTNHQLSRHHRRRHIPVPFTLFSRHAPHTRSCSSTTGTKGRMRTTKTCGKLPPLSTSPRPHTETPVVPDDPPHAEHLPSRLHPRHSFRPTGMQRRRGRKYCILSCYVLRL